MVFLANPTKLQSSNSLISRGQTTGQIFDKNKREPSTNITSWHLQAAKHRQQHISFVLLFAAFVVHRTAKEDKKNREI